MVFERSWVRFPVGPCAFSSPVTKHQIPWSNNYAGWFVSCHGQRPRKRIFSRRGSFIYRIQQLSGVCAPLDFCCLCPVLQSHNKAPKAYFLATGLIYIQNTTVEWSLRSLGLLLFMPSVKSRAITFQLSIRYASFGYSPW